MQAIWKGSISFGLVNIPVKVCGAVEPKKISFNQIHETCKSRIKHQKYCPSCKKEVLVHEVIKGYQTQKGMIPVTESDLASIPLASLKTIELDGFIKEQKVDSMYYQKPYYLLPEKSDQAYWLLYHALKKSGKVGIARFSVHSREHLALVRPAGNSLILCTLYYPDEIRKVNAVPVKPDKKHLDLAIGLIESQAIAYDPEQYTDRYQESLEKMLEGRQPDPIIEPQRIGDLMEALRLSLEKTKKERKPA
jgi:DNA end-binding protein Ku